MSHKSNENLSTHLPSGGSSSSRSRIAVIDVITPVKHPVIFLYNIKIHRAPSRSHGTMRRRAPISRMLMASFTGRIIPRQTSWALWVALAAMSVDTVRKYVCEHMFTPRYNVCSFVLYHTCEPTTHIGASAATDAAATNSRNEKPKHGFALVYAAIGRGILSAETVRCLPEYHASDRKRRRLRRHDCQQHITSGHGQHFINRSCSESS